LPVTVSTLETAGVISTVAENGQVALNLIQKNNYDLILMDVQMPIMDGLEATRCIRDLKNSVPIIAMTANVFKEDQDDCLRAGMNDFVSKPIDPQRFFETIHKWLPEEPVRNDREDAMDVRVNHATIDPELYLERLNRIDGLDVARGLNNLQGNVKKMHDLLMRMCTDYLEKINTCFAQQNVAISEVKNCAHSLKGASGNLGWTKVQKQTERIENRILRGEDLHAMIQDITKLKTILEDAHSILNQPFESEASYSVHSVSTQEVRKVLQQAEELLLAFDTSVVELIDHNRHALNSLDEALTKQLIESISAFEFTKAIKLIQQLSSLIN